MLGGNHLKEPTKAEIYLQITYFEDRNLDFTSELKDMSWSKLQAITKEMTRKHKKDEMSFREHSLIINKHNQKVISRLENQKINRSFLKILIFWVSHWVLESQTQNIGILRKPA